MAASPAKGGNAQGHEIAETLRRIYDQDLTTTSGGNLSIRDADGSIWITPAGVDKGTLRAEQVAHVGADGCARSTTPPPSSELPFHRAIYAARDDLRAIVHAHPVSLVAFSIAQEVPDTRVSAPIHALCGRVGFAHYALPGSRALGERIASVFERGFVCVLLQNHGVVVAGKTLREAFERLEALDLCARIILNARQLGRERPLPDDALDRAPTRRVAAPRPEASERSDEENDLRETMGRIVARARRKRLMTATQGRLSARLGVDAFLITPAGAPPEGMGIAEIQRHPLAPQHGDALDPTESLHASLYRAHPEVGAIVQGVGAHTTAFCTAGVALPARTIPESYLLVRDPVTIPLARLGEQTLPIADLIGPDTPVGLIENGGGIALGLDPLDAFDRLEVLEASAAAVLSSLGLGGLETIDDERIAELRRAYFPAGGLRLARPEPGDEVDARAHGAIPSESPSPPTPGEKGPP